MRTVVKRKADMNAELEKILEGYRDEMVEKLQEFIRIEFCSCKQRCGVHAGNAFRERLGSGSGVYDGARQGKGLCDQKL